MTIPEPRPTLAEACADMAKLQSGSDSTAENLRDFKSQFLNLIDALELARSYLKAGMPLDDDAKHLLADYDILVVEGVREFLPCLDAAIEGRERDE